MRQTFVVEGRLPSLNEYINAERRNRFAAAKMKKEWETVLTGYIRKAHLRRCKRPVVLVYDHYVPDRRRDRDNIAAIAHKFTQDALVSTGVLHDDGWDYVLNSFDQWHIDKGRPRIEITIEEKDDE